MKRKLLTSLSHFSGMTLISRVMGLIRDMSIAFVLGAHVQADAFFVAFKIPNFMRRLFAEGAFSQAFVPVLAEYRSREDEVALQSFIDQMAGVLSFCLLLTVILGIFIAPYLLRIFAPGFAPAGDRYPLAVTMLRVMFPYLFFISLTAFAAAILNSYERFAMPAFTPVILNLALIVAAWLAWHYHWVAAHTLAWGVLVAGFLQLLFLLPFLKQIKQMPILAWGFKHPGVKRVLKQMVPALFGVSIAQINLMVDTLFASFLAIGSVTWLYNSDRLASLPLGVFGVAIATVVLPYLSRQQADHNQQAYNKSLDWGLTLVLLIGVPASLGLTCLAGPALTTLLQYGAFSAHDVWMASHSLIAFASGLPAFMAVKILASAYYARGDIRTPVRIAVVAMLTNIVLNSLFIKPLAHVGLALATSLAAYLNAVLLYLNLRRKQIYQTGAAWVKLLGQCFVANSLMVLWLQVMRWPLDQWFQWHWVQRLSHLLLLISVAMLSYFISLWALRFKWETIRL